ncbi:hypothetical protein LWI28_015146 [Acer negundo]|uniref:Uncharacterized protein n=1 Tax=Acer negundo TaxID=4023 RepID=A0AAD5J4F5_ACENE|nr:hypothetical protein LWI28_015146 [Acer negundo]
MAKLERTVAPLSKEKKDFDATADRAKKELDRVQKKLEIEKTHSTLYTLKRNELKSELAAIENHILENANGVDEPLPGQMVFSDGVDIVSSSDLFISKRKELDGEGAALEPPVVELKALIMDT